MKRKIPSMALVAVLAMSLASALALLTFPAAAREDRGGSVNLLRVPNKGIQPQVAMDKKGVLHMIYFGGDPRHGDIFYVRSTDEGKTFSQALRVNSVRNSAMAIGNIRGGQMALGKNGRVHVAWNEVSKKGAGLGGMSYTRLTDDGKAFEPQQNVMRKTETLDGGGSVAADDAGNVYVVWHAREPGKEGEGNRRVWVARSTDEGKTFAEEKAAYEKSTGACGCCGLRAFDDHKGTVYVLYRTAQDRLNRDTCLLTSSDKGGTFHGDIVQQWKTEACPMSSYGFTAGSAGVLAAWETKGQVFFARIDPLTRERSAPVVAPGDGGNRKHPVVACDKHGRILLAWAEGVGWERGGAVAWQVFDKDGKPTGDRGRADGVPIWSLVAVFPRAAGGFTVVY